MKKMRKADVITALALTVVMLAAMTGIAAADPLIVAGTVIDSNNQLVENALVIAYEDENHDTYIGEDLTGANGAYTIFDGDSTLPEGAIVYATASKPNVGSDDNTGTVEGDKGVHVSFMLFKLDIPEFATIAIPVASILGLMLFFNHRKHKKE